jgi:hypothetical protein
VHGPSGTPQHPFVPQPKCPRCGNPAADGHTCHPEAVRIHTENQAREARAELDSPNVIPAKLEQWAVDPHRDAPDTDQPEPWEASWPRRRAFADWQRERENA